MNVDYIIVGCGLAGIAFCEQLKANNNSFLVFDNESQQSSIVAGGLYNPVVLKRFTPVWKSKEQLELALPVYKKIEEKLNIKLDYKIPVYRLFSSVEEQNNWFTASDKANLSNWLSTKIIQNHNPYIKAKFGFGEVLHTGRINSKSLIKEYKHALKVKNQLYSESFNYDELTINSNDVKYKHITSKSVVFAEGYGVKKNPFFNYLPLKGTKGELLIIHAPKLKLEFVLKSSVFLIPLGEDTYIVGATYNWKDKTNSTTKEARQELLDKLYAFLDCEFEIVDQVAGIRPTVIDRRPLVGRHELHEHLFILNGLGTRGVMIAPFIAHQLFQFIEHKKPLDKEINIKRFN